MVDEIKYKDLSTCRKCHYLVSDNLCRHHKDKPKFIYVTIDAPGLYVCGNFEKDA